MKQVIVMRTDLNMRKGKMAAQAGHAVLGCALGADIEVGIHVIAGADTYWTAKEQEWIAAGMPKIVVGIDSKEGLENIIAACKEVKIKVFSVTDAGHTEFHGVPTLTCCAIGPDDNEKIDVITGKLKLL